MFSTYYFLGLFSLSLNQSLESLFGEIFYSMFWDERNWDSDE